MGCDITECKKYTLQFRATCTVITAIFEAYARYVFGSNDIINAVSSTLSTHLSGIVLESFRIFRSIVVQYLHSCSIIDIFRAVFLMKRSYLELSDVSIGSD